MKKAFFVVSLPFFLWSCGTKIINQFEIVNSGTDTVTDAQVVLLRDSVLKKCNTSLENKAIVITNSNGEIIPSQLDDIDGDGNWDELALVYTLAPNEKVTLNIQLVSKSQAPLYKARTQANFGKKIDTNPVVYLKSEMLPKAPLPRGAGYPYKTDGPTWESDKAGYRHYFDGRNCRDYFCKLIPDMVLDTVGIWPDGTIGDTYHTLKSWGRDVLGVGQSFGLGGVAAIYNDSLVRLGVLRSDSVDNSDSTLFTLVANGPVRSIIRISNYGWDLGGAKINVKQDISIWAGRYVYENNVTFEGDSTAKFLVTGLVHNNDSNGLQITTIDPGLKVFYTHDKQTYNRQYYMGLALFVPADKLVDNFDTPAAGPGILYTYCAKLQAPFDTNLKYYAMAACELQTNRWVQKEQFENLIKKEGIAITAPIQVTFK